MSDLFGWFLLALRFSATNFGMKKTLMMSTGTCGLRLYARKNKKKYKYEILNHLYFGPGFVFWGTALERFSQCFFLIFRPWSTMVTEIFTQPPPPPPPHHKKASYGPGNNYIIFVQKYYNSTTLSMCVVYTHMCV